MTERLYRSDSFLSTFDARVLEVGESGGAPWAVLDRTAFYATAGGQPNDLGALGGVAVVDVIEREDGAIAHALGAAAPFGPGDVVGGTIDFARRFDHMQQHSGQHLLSQAFSRAAGATTLSVHFGPEGCSVDVDAAALSSSELAAVEEEANRALHSDLAVIVREVPEDEVGRFGLRRPPKVSGRVRIVEFEGYDWSACGGTHVRRSGQVGVIKILKAERRRGGTRVSFLCGSRAVRHHRALNDQATALGDAFSVGPLEVVAAVDRLRAEARDARARLSDALDRLLAAEAEALWAAAPDSEAGRRIVAIFQDREPEALRQLAKLLTARPRTAALLASAGKSAFLCFSRSETAPGDMSALLKAALAALGARGGGSPSYAQGGGPPATMDKLRDILADLK